MIRTACAQFAFIRDRSAARIVVSRNRTDKIIHHTLDRATEAHPLDWLPDIGGCQGELDVVWV